MEILTDRDMQQLIRSVFPLHPDDRRLGILVDIPRDPAEDSTDWKERRNLAVEWYHALKRIQPSLHLDEVILIAYPDVGSNNADLPEFGTLIKGQLPSTAEALSKTGEARSFRDIFRNTQIFLAPTQYSTTAPLKVAAVTYDFRAATMPGFSSQMIPTLKLDYEEVNRRVLLLKEKLDRAMGADVHFTVDGEEDFEVYFDLRFRQAHASTGRFPEKGTAGNLPSGEAYIVPYEGEKGEASQTQGMLPVQIRDDLVLFNIKHNRAVGVEGLVPAILEEKAHLEREPAYGNMAELGFGVLADFGILPVGKILLDEKLGFHVAFGRSEHFGGSVGPEDFSAPSEVIHLDRIYIPATQPRITVKSLVLLYENGQGEILIEGGKYLIF
jgi:aminopeptidase